MSDERLIMDPSGVAPEGRTPLDITPIVAAAGLDSGDTVAEQYKAQGDYGEDAIDRRWPNIPMSAPLIIRDVGGTTLAEYRSLLQGKVAQWQREGGVLGRYTSSGTAFATVVNANLALGGDILQALGRVDANAVLGMERRPGWEEGEVELELHEETTNPELIFTETGIKGDMPAPVRVEVIEKEGQDQKGLIWSFRSRRYSAATTAKSAYAAIELQPLGIATKEAVSGAMGGTAVSNTSLSSQWGPVVGTNIGGTVYLTHQGTYRVYARIRSPQGTAVSARLVWDVGDLTYPTENSAYTFPAGSAWYVANLGEVRLDAAPVGTHRWQGQIQAKGTEGGEDINIDRIWLLNEDDGMGVLTAPLASPSSIAVPVASDNFNATTAGTLSGKVAPLGGTWVAGGTAGTSMDLVGFTVDTTNKYVTRAASSDADLNQGFYQRLGAGTAASVSAKVDFRLPIGNLVSRSGLFVRYVNVSNYLMAFCEPVAIDGSQAAVVIGALKRVGGTVTRIGESARTITLGAFYTIEVQVDATGSCLVLFALRGSSLSSAFSVVDSSLATGGSLESGGYGIYDAFTESTTLTRIYDNFSVGPAPTADAVVYASQRAQVTTEGMYRLDVAGSAYGPISRVRGDLPRLPVGGTSEVLIKASRGDLDQVADSGIDDVATRLYYRPTWLTFPD